MNCVSGGQCTDDNASCESWAEGGECEKNPKYMLVNCKKSCKQCTVKPVTVKPVTVKPVTVAPTSRCEDSNNNCQSWASRGECDKNPEWMGENCKKSCGTCPTTGMLVPTQWVHCILSFDHVGKYSCLSRALLLERTFHQSLAMDILLTFSSRWHNGEII